MSVLLLKQTKVEEAISILRFARQFRIQRRGMNFDFLKTRTEYAMFAPACVEAERTLSTSPAMCAVGCRKALELAVKWVYAADSSLTMPYKDNLSSLIHETSFQRVVDRVTWRMLPFIVKLGNKSVHTDRKVSPQDALLALKALFGFVQWIDYCYGGDAYEERAFDEHQVPLVKLALDVQTIKQREALLAQKEDVIRRQEEEIKQLRSQFAAAKAQALIEDDFNPDTISERETRRRYIDLDIEYAGWDLERNVETEVEVQGMPNSQGVGYIDYVLNGADGKPLAIVEAKRTMHDAKKGLQQARLYAQCLEMRYGYPPFVFLSNGFETFFCDDISGSERPCSGVFSPEDLQRLINRRGMTLPLSSMRVNQDIAGRYYQIEAIRAICANMEEGHRRSLLVMATGTGKTRTAAGLVDVLLRANRASNILFLADRVALVSQAKAAFQEYLPNLSLCNLCSTKDRTENSSARMVFSTYPSVLNAIDTVKMGDGRRLFTPAHFDLIIVDEAHRSIFKKYRAIFDYFDAQVLGLTATPKDEVDRNTYDFFEVERGVPTYVYEYDTAVKQDHYLVPYYNIEVATKFLDEGISYDDLTEEDRERLDDDWEETYGEEAAAPEFMPSSALNSWVFNEKTVDTVLQDIMENGAKVAGGERLGKTIIFAKNKKHAQFIVDRFNALYPKRGGFARRVVHGDDYSDTIIEDFKFKELPVIAVSVDKMDTGIDVPQVLNLVFFKQVHSKTKFWQMIGRGTRLCPDLMVTDCLDGEYLGKRRFFIFDYCGNFEFFRQGKDVAEGKNPESLSERVFKRKVAIVEALQNPAFLSGDYQTWRGELIGEVVRAVNELRVEPLKVAVKLHLHSIERFSSGSAFLSLNKGDVGELEREIAPLIVLEESDQYALRFDALMYGYMVAVLLGESVDAYRRRVVDLAFRLQHKMTIPQVKERRQTIALVVEEDYLDHADALMLEGVRTELRSLIKFLIDGSELPALVTSLTDPVISRREGEEISPGEDFTDYRLKVNRYVIDHGDMTVIHKLRNNIPMTALEYRELERVFMEELGSEADYRRTYGETPLGLLVRRIAKLDHDAAMEAFAEFINDESLSQQQMAFVHRVVDYVEQNGYMDPSALAKAPFDRPVSFFRLFDDGRQKRLVQIINQVRENALTPVA